MLFLTVLYTSFRHGSISGLTETDSGMAILVPHHFDERYPGRRALLMFAGWT
jgi:hypothetical protein